MQHSRVSSILRLNRVTYTITRACSSYGNLIDGGRLLTQKLVDQGYTLDKLNIYFGKFMVNTLMNLIKIPMLISTYEINIGILSRLIIVFTFFVSRIKAKGPRNWC